MQTTQPVSAPTVEVSTCITDIHLSIDQFFSAIFNILIKILYITCSNQKKMKDFGH